MSNYTAGKEWKVSKEHHIMEKAFQLFAKKGIDSVTMPEIAAESGVGRATLYRYFSSKAELVIATGAWKWEEFIKEYNAGRTQEEMAMMRGDEWLRYYLAVFIDLYRNHRDILRYNYDFNSYIKHELRQGEQIQPYTDILVKLRRNFHNAYERGMKDHTLNADVPEEIMFSSSFHIMMAAATRYAMGLVYTPGANIDPETELIMLKNMMLSKFTTSNKMMAAI